MNERTYDDVVAGRQVAMEKAGADMVAAIELEDRAKFAQSLQAQAKVLREIAEEAATYEGAGMLIGLMGGRKTAKRGREFAAKAEGLEHQAQAVLGGGPVPWEGTA